MISSSIAEPSTAEFIPFHVPWHQRKNFLSGKEAMRQLSMWLQLRRELEDKRLYFLSVTYTFKKGEERTTRSINWNFERVHRRLLQYLARSHNYHRAWFRAIEPTFYVFVDAPNSKQKHSKKPLHVGNRDSTLHHHVIIVADAKHEDDLDGLVASNDPVSILLGGSAGGSGKNAFGVREMKFQRISSGSADVSLVVNYAASTAIEHYASQKWDDYFIVLPKARSEGIARQGRAQQYVSASFPLQAKGSAT